MTLMRLFQQVVHQVVYQKYENQLKSFFNDKEPSIGINPDEAIAYGAAVQAGFLSGENVGVDVILFDVNPLTLGIETVGGFMSIVIPSNSLIPNKISKGFTTVIDNLEEILVKVYEGERPMTEDNHFLGNFRLTVIPLAPRGIPKVEVTFDFDVNGILTVSAEDRGTGNKNNIVINKTLIE